MKKFINAYAKIGLIHFMAYPQVIKGEGPVLETFRKIAVDDYFDAVEITWIKDKSIRKEVKKMIDTSHIEVAYGAQPRLLTTGLNINNIDENGRLEALETLKEGIEEAYEMGAKGFGFLSGQYEEEMKEEAYQALVKSTKEICAYAKSLGEMTVALEVFDYDVDKKSLIGPAALAKRFAEEITSEFDNFGLMVDLSHLPILRETAEETLNLLKDYIVHAHMGNAVAIEGCLAYGDQHPRFGFPNGANDVEELVEYLRVLLEIGYLDENNRRFLSFEVKGVGDEEPELVIANAKRVLNRAWNMIS